MCAKVKQFFLWYDVSSMHFSCTILFRRTYKLTNRVSMLTITPNSIKTIFYQVLRESYTANVFMDAFRVHPVPFINPVASAESMKHVSWPGAFVKVVKISARLLPKKSGCVNTDYLLNPLSFRFVFLEVNMSQVKYGERWKKELCKKKKNVCSFVFETVQE